jgi:uncharacterized protein (TIGR02145 family)
MENTIRVEARLFVFIVSVFGICIILYSCNMDCQDDELNDYKSTTSLFASVRVSGDTAFFRLRIGESNIPSAIAVEYGTSEVYEDSVLIRKRFVGKEDVEFVISGLKYSVKYHFRTKAIFESGVQYGKDSMFTSATPKVVDIDGNVYRSVKIGDQVWLAENLRVTHYNDGTQIPNVKNASEWEQMKTGAYCSYNNELGLGRVYGLLYNWYTIDSKKIAPKGWHVPTNEEWKRLVATCDSLYGNGNALKDIGCAYWRTPNLGTNKTGFQALPGGGRYYTNASPENVRFCDMFTDAIWWSGDEYNKDGARVLYISHNSSNLVNNCALNKISGCSVRLVKD